MTVCAEGVPPGLGEPVFDKLDADIAHAMMGINAVKAVEIGDGVAVAAQRGSEHRDELTPTGFLPITPAARSAASPPGQPIVVHLSLKPTSSIQIPGRTIDVAGNAVEVATTGRHDPCVGLRAVPIAEAMLAIVLMDHYLRHRAQNADVVSPDAGHHAARERSAQQERSTMSKSFRVAVVGATGLVGDTMVRVLEERDFPVAELYRTGEQPLARQDRWSSRASACRSQELSSFDFSQADIALFSAGSEVSAEYAPKAAAAGCIVIDNTSQFRYEDDVPLVVPEVNAHAIANYRQRRIIANPNCSTIQMLVALNPIHRRGRHRAHQRCDLSVGLGRGQGSGRGTGRADGEPAQRSPDRGAARARQADRFQLCAPDR